MSPDRSKYIPALIKVLERKENELTDTYDKYQIIGKKVIEYWDLNHEQAEAYLIISNKLENKVLKLENERKILRATIRRLEDEKKPA